MKATGSKAVSIDTRYDKIHGVVQTRSLKTATALTGVDAPPTLQTNKVMHARLKTASGGEKIKLK